MADDVKDEPHQEVLVRSRKGWRCEMAKWVEDERKQDAHNKEAANDNSETARDALNTAMYG